MENATKLQLVRLVGVMAIGVAAAWVLQVLGLAGSDGLGRLLWIVGAATIAGIGAGLIYSSAIVMPTGSFARAPSR